MTSQVRNVFITRWSSPQLSERSSRRQVAATIASCKRYARSLNVTHPKTDCHQNV